MRPVERLPFAAREHEAVGTRREEAQPLGQRDGDRVGERHFSDLASLRLCEHELPGEHLHLLTDEEAVTQEIDVCHPQPEHLALARPGARGDDGECAVRACR